MTLIALVVTIVVLLILAGIAITYVLGDNSVFKQAQEAKLKSDIAKYQEMLETAKGPIIIQGLGKFDKDKYFQEIQDQGIINNKEKDVIDNGDGTYDVTTKPGYVFEIELMPNKENPTDGRIEYVGQAGKIKPIIKKIEVSATATSITGKATVARLGNGTITYYYKLKTAGDDSYTQITNIDEETGATQSTDIVVGDTYVIKVVAKNDIGEVSDTKEITAMKIFVESIKITPSSVVVKKQATVTLKATVEPENATNKKVKWSSLNTNIATIDPTGVITANNIGTTKVTATSDDDNVNVSCDVMVYELADNLLKTGDYVYYEDNSNTKRKCSVMYTSNSSAGLQIAPVLPVENYYLFVSGLERTIEAWNNRFTILNEQCEKYINSDFAVSARCFGSSPTGRSAVRNYFTFPSPLNTNGLSGRVYGQEEPFLEDLNSGFDLDAATNIDCWYASGCKTTVGSSLYMYSPAFYKNGAFFDSGSNAALQLSIYPDRIGEQFFVSTMGANSCIQIEIRSKNY